MLKLKKIHILGFKSFCDRTELAVPGSGIAVVVGPNGCGKSNILDGVSWVLGEQSAKSLRGTHMQDVIFAGTRERKALGMAEVTLTLVDPEAYEGPIPVEPEIAVEPEGPGEWDEEEMRRQRAVEAEEIIAAEQPGQALDEDDPEAPQEAATTAGPQAVVLKIPGVSSIAPRRRAKSSSRGGCFGPAKANTCSTANSAGFATFKTSSWERAWVRRATP